jgi:cytochrome P450
LNDTISATQLVLNLIQDTSAGALSTLFYFLAKNSIIQRRARAEIAAAVVTADLTADNLSAASLPFLNACIREALRINSSSRT